MRYLKMRAAMVGAVVAALALAGCGGGAEEAATKKIAGSCDSVDLSNPPGEPVTIRMGHGQAAEEPVWAQYADPKLAGAGHYGTWYTLDAKAYAPNDRLDAYQAGQLDAGTISPPQLIRAVAQGLDLRAVASAKLEAEGGFNTTYVALEGKGISGPGDLEGKKVGILAPNTSTDYWARSAVAKAGLNPERDVQYVSLPFPEQEEALRAGTIDVAVLVQPFYSIAMSKGGLTRVFTSLTGPGVDQELISVFFDTKFIEENPGGYCAWREDFVATLGTYEQDRKAVAQVLIEKGLLRAPSAEAFAKQQDWKSTPDGKIDLASMDAMIQNMQEVRFLPPPQAVPAKDLVLEGYSLVQ